MEFEVQAPEITTYETERGKPMPSYNHSIIQVNLAVALRNHYGKKFSVGSEMDLALPKAAHSTVPDICIFPKRIGKLSKDIIKVKEPPITTIEILSPMQRLEEVKNKILDNYFPAGVQSAWLIIPTARTVSVYSPDGKFTTYASGEINDPVTGITLEIDEVFEELE